MKRRFRFRYRFTFFQRQFVSHLVISLLVLILLCAGFVYYYEKQIYATQTEELSSATRVVARLLSKEEEEPAAALNAYRVMLAERKISFIILDKSGQIVHRDPKMSAGLRAKPFLDSLRSRIFTMKDFQSFVLGSSVNQKVVVVPKYVRLKNQNKELFLYVLSPLHGIQEVLASLNKAFLYTVGIVFLLAVVTSLIVSRNLSRSIQSLRHATRLITQGEYAARSPVRRSDELGDLSQDFNSMAERLEEASKKINQYEGRRRQFLMDVTHELRTPLTSIRGITEGLKSGLVTLPEDKMKYYSIIEKETFRLIRLINELLDMEKIESGMIDLNHSVTGLKDLLEVITESLEVLVEEKKLQLTIECDPDIRIYGDYDRLVQILINLVKNSIQFTDYGSIRLTGSETKEATVIVVSDTGKGMTPQELSLIWERFYKSDASRTKNKSETGLGLSIVKKLVEAHQGVITVESIPGIGSTFTITLPKSDSQLAAALRNENMP